jgi:dienelactone hydrolase
MSPAASVSHSAARTVRVVTRDATLTGDLTVPDEPIGIVVFAHGSGSSRLSPRNRQVAASLQRAHLATLLIDLLSPEEEALDRGTAEYRFDIALLARRLRDATEWLATQPDTQDLPIGYFGASTGAAAALVAAAQLGDHIGAVVSRGGRPDLAGQHLAHVAAPTLLIVGQRDPVVLDLNITAQRSLRGESNLRLVPGATHLFEEPGALEIVSVLAQEWFVRHLARNAVAV